MVDHEKAENFKKVMKKGKWHERYIVVREKYFITNNLIEDKECRMLLLDAALREKAKLVKEQAVRTCNLLKITYKGQEVRLKKMPNIDVVTKMNIASRKELVFQAAMQTDISLFPRHRKLTDEEKRKLSIKFEELNPKLYDIMDGYYTNNSPGVINKKKNKKLQTVFEGYLSEVSNKRIIKYYKEHPQRLEYEPEEYKEKLQGKVELR